MALVVSCVNWNSIHKFSLKLHKQKLAKEKNYHFKRQLKQNLQTKTKKNIFQYTFKYIFSLYQLSMLSSLFLSSVFLTQFPHFQYPVQDMKLLNILGSHFRHLMVDFWCKINHMISWAMLIAYEEIHLWFMDSFI